MAEYRCRNLKVWVQVDKDPNLAGGVIEPQPLVGTEAISVSKSGGATLVEEDYLFWLDL